MATKRVTHTFRKGDILEVKEYHDGRYGARGLPREKKRKPTPEQMAVVNAMNKAETARHRLLEYFGKGDYFLTLTYRVEARPPDMAKAKKDFTNLISKLRTRYKKEQIELRWIRNIEKGTKGAWHVHMVITGCRDTIRWVESMQNNWRKANTTKRISHSSHPTSQKTRRWEKRGRMERGTSQDSVNPVTVHHGICH